jgi:hypothetical protein
LLSQFSKIGFKRERVSLFPEDVSQMVGIPDDADQSLMSRLVSELRANNGNLQELLANKAAGQFWPA